MWVSVIFHIRSLHIISDALNYLNRVGFVDISEKSGSHLALPNDVSVSGLQKSWCCVFICLCSEEVSRHGFTVIVDMRGSKWDSIKPLLKILQESFPSCIHVALIIKPDNFWQKQRTNFGSSKFEFEVSTLNMLMYFKESDNKLEVMFILYSIRLFWIFFKPVVWDYHIFSRKKLRNKKKAITQSIYVLLEHSILLVWK